MIVTKPVILQKLQAEMLTAGLSIRGLVLAVDTQGRSNVFSSDPQGKWIELPPEAQAVIDAHDGTPPPAPDYGADAPDDYPDQLAGVVSQLRAYRALGLPSQAQTVAVVKLLIAAVLFLLRRQLR